MINRRLVLNSDRKKGYLYIFAITFLYIFIFLKIFPTILPYTEGGLYASIEFDVERMVLGVTTIVLMIGCAFQCELRFRQSKSVSHIMMLTLYLFYFIPGQIINTVYTTDIGYFRLYIIYWIFLEIFLRFSYKIKIVVKRNRTLRQNHYSKRYVQYYELFVVLILLSAIGISLIYSNGSLTIFNMFDLNSVTETRMESREANIHWILWYPILATSMLNPVWLQRAWKKKNVALIVLILFATVSMYSVGNNRAFLLNLFIGFALCFLDKKDNSVSKIVLCCLVICALEFLISETFLENIAYANPFNNVMKRLFATPNVISRHYVEFFSENPADWLRQNWSRYFSILGINSRYSEPIPSLIGNIFYISGMNANTGLLGAAFANYGYFGLIISPLLYVISFRLLDFCSSRIKEVEEIIVLGIIFGITIPNSLGFMELIMTPSYLLICYVLVFLMPQQTFSLFEGKRGWKSRNKKRGVAVNNEKSAGY